MTIDDTRRECRRLLSEYAAAVEEYRSLMSPEGLPRPMVYGEGLFLTAVPFITASLDSAAENLDDFEEVGLEELRDALEPLIQLRRVHRARVEAHRAAEGGHD